MGFGATNLVGSVWSTCQAAVLYIKYTLVSRMFCCIQKCETSPGIGSNVKKHTRSGLCLAPRAAKQCRIGHIKISSADRSGGRGAISQGLREKLVMSYITSLIAASRPPAVYRRPPNPALRFQIGKRPAPALSARCSGPQPAHKNTGKYNDIASSGASPIEAYYGAYNVINHLQ